MERIWECIMVGNGNPLTPDREKLLVEAIKIIYKDLSGVDCDFCFVKSFDLSELLPSYVEIIKYKLGEAAEGQRAWQCKIGGECPDHLPDGADLPIRSVARRLYIATTRSSDYVCFSGWAANLTREEREQVA